MVSCYKLIGVRSFILEVRSWSGNAAPLNLYQRNGILCLDRKGQGPKAQLSLSKVQSWLRGGKSPLAIPSQLVSHTLPSCYP